jgi:hypothetical protein
VVTRGRATGLDGVEARWILVAEGLLGRAPLVERHAHIILEVLAAGPLRYQELRESVGFRLYGSNIDTSWLEGRRIDKALDRLAKIGAVGENASGEVTLTARGHAIHEEPAHWFFGGRLPISFGELEVLRKNRSLGIRLGLLGVALYLICAAAGHGGVGLVGISLAGGGIYLLSVGAADNGSSWRELIPWRYDHVPIVDAPSRL